ncbi:MAG: hypoxanthine phosphoribosyltransferase [Bacteroidia bacterium]|nr:hypoxanthine phosphoribosyltransferase [Bacteroidia bacterium]
MQIKDKQFKILFTHNQIDSRIAEFARELNQQYTDSQTIPVLIPVLTGAYRFFSDLFVKLTFPYEVRFAKLSSYGSGMASQNEVITNFPIQPEIKNREVIVIEDVVDTGLTLDVLHYQLQDMQPASMRIASLLFKPSAFRGIHKPDWAGFEISDLFVVGYGMDYAEQGRYLSDIYQLDGPSQI